MLSRLLLSDLATEVPQPRLALSKSDYYYYYYYYYYYTVFHENNPLDFLLYLCQIMDNFNKKLSSMYVRKCIFLYYEKLLHIH